MACIYKIENLINGKIYIGSTHKVLNKRKSEHFSLLRKNKHYNKKLQNAWNKYGEESFSIVSIEDLFFPNSYSHKMIDGFLCGREALYIEQLKPFYNIKIVIERGIIGYSPSQETRLKISKKSSGRKVSEETKIKIREARKKQVITPAHKLAISRGLKGKKHAKKRIVSKETIIKAINTKRKKAEERGYYFKESTIEKRRIAVKQAHNNPINKEINKQKIRSRLSKPFKAFKNSIEIGIFYTQVEAKEKLNLKRSSDIGAVLNGVQKTYNGYTFKYL